MKISRIYTVAAYQPIGEWIAARMFSRGERMWMTDEDVANAGCWFVLMLGIVLLLRTALLLSVLLLRVLLLGNLAKFGEVGQSISMV